MTTQAATRRLDLDWLRVLSILAIYVFHSTRFFDTMDWHVKNTRQYHAVLMGQSFYVAWGMPLIFAISAASTFYALGSRSTAVFLKDRLLRLGVPLAVGIFTHAALQVYLEDLTHYRFRGSFWAFYPRYFDGFSGFGGHFAWHGMHLWYLLILLVFSIVFLPILAWLRSDSGQRVYTAIGNALAVPGIVYLLALPIGGAILIAQDDSLFLTKAFGGWNLLGHAQFFLYAFVITTHERVRRTIEQSRWVSLVVALLAFGGLLALDAGAGIRLGSLRPVIGNMLYALGGWLLVLTWLGFGTRHLTTASPLLKYANEAVLPFYVLHQTVLLVVGYFVVRWPIPDLLKFVLISVCSFGLIMLIYEYLIRRVNVLRFLFGMRPLPRERAVLRTA